MKKIKSLAIVSALIVGLFGIPLVASAVSDDEDTTINAVIASVISITTSGTVNINVTPIGGGSQSSASDTVSVSTNNTAGYNLTLANSDSDTDLENGANTIAAHTGTFAEPSALANNSWGYAVAELGDFDESYTTLNNAASSSSLWAGVPVNASPQNIKSTSSTASEDTTTVWYSVKADTSKPNGTYSDIVTYTATTK